MTCDTVYIHIPFCRKICAYCDFCKVLYNKEYVMSYLKALEEEIISTYKGEEITTIYIGGGTPSSLSEEELIKLFEILKHFHLAQNYELTFEANSDSLNEEKIKILKKYGVNRVSIGLETTKQNLQKILKRTTDQTEVKTTVVTLRKHGITNINLDLIYAIPSETIKDLTSDLTFLLKLNVPHISTYSLIIEDNTLLKIKGLKNISLSLDRKMYDHITKTLEKNGYNHYEISNFAKKGYESRHNLKYWQNKQYYGFGVGASSYLNNTRYTTTRSLTKYLKGKSLTNGEHLSLADTINYEVILNLRTSYGINKEEFLKKYHQSIDSFFNYKDLVTKKILTETEETIAVNKEYYYVLNEVILKFLNTLQTNV